MKFSDEYKEVIVVVIIVVVLFVGMSGTVYLSNQPASNDPLIIRKVKVTLITGEKRELSFLLNKGSKLNIESYKGSYSLIGTWHSRLGWNTKKLKDAVIDFEEIK
jgi:hypothetical protein